MSSTGFLNKFTKIVPVPSSLMPGFVGIDLCEDSVRAIRMKKSNVGMVPVKFKEYKMKERCGLFSPQVTLEECDEVFEVLKRIKKDFKVNYVNVSIPESKTYIYKTKIPSSAYSNIAETLLFSLSEHVPIEPQEVVIDYFIIDDDGAELDLIVSVIPKIVIETYTEIFEKAGLHPIAFEPETHAISRGIIGQYDKTPYVILNLDNNGSSIAIVENGLVQYTQTLPIMSVDKDGLFSEESLKTLKENINRVIIYWFTSEKHSEEDRIQNMLLVGEKGSSTRLVNFLEKNMSLNVNFANVWKNSFDLNDYIPSLHAKDSLHFATATGLALKKLK